MNRIRLHRSSLVVALVATVVMTLVVIPGVSPFLTDDARTPIVRGTIDNLDHGWPAIFLRREVSFWQWPQPPYHANYPSKPLLGVPWLSLNAWKMWQATQYEFFLENLLLDLSVALLIVIASASMWEWRLRRRKHVFQFRTTDLLTGIAFTAAVLGWFTYHRHEYDRERPHIVALEESEAQTVFVHDLCVAPSSLVRLIGANSLPQYLWRAAEANVDTYIDRSLASFESSIPHLMTFKRLRSVEFGPLPEDSEYPFALLASLRHLRELDISQNDADGTIDAAAAQRLIQLQQLTTLTIMKRTDLTPKAWELVREQLPNCEVVYWNDE